MCVCKQLVKQSLHVIRVTCKWVIYIDWYDLKNTGSIGFDLVSVASESDVMVLV